MTINEIVAAVRTRGSLPTAGSSSSISDQKIIDAANSELTLVVAPLLALTREGYFTDTEDTSIVANQASYSLPTRAIDSGAIAVKYVDSSGQELYPLDQVTPHEISSYTYTGYAQQFYLNQQGIVLIPTPTNASGSLRVYYDRRPGSLVSNVDSSGTLGLTGGQTTATGVVSSVSYNSGTGNTTITLTVNTNGWPASTTIDVMSYLPPFKLRAKDVTTTTAAAGTATILCTSIDLTSSTYGVAAGDYVTVARNAFVPQIPLEWHEILTDLIPARVANQLSMYKQEEHIREALVPKIKLLQGLAEPRAQQNPKAIKAAWTNWRTRY